MSFEDSYAIRCTKDPNWICKMFHHVIGTIHPIALVRTGFGKSLRILDKGAPLRLRDSNPSFFNISRPFEEAF